MKNRTYTLISVLSISLLVLFSCNKDKEPAVTMAGTYTGSFEGKYLGEDTLTSSGYQVQVVTVNDNKVLVNGNNFESFEVLVTTNGLNIEAVSQADPYLSNFIYIGDENKLKFTFNKGTDKAKFIGTK